MAANASGSSGWPYSPRRNPPWSPGEGDGHEPEPSGHGRSRAAGQLLAGLGADADVANFQNVLQQPPVQGVQVHERRGGLPMSSGKAASQTSRITNPATLRSVGQCLIRSPRLR
jgi:hypothetical protein